MRFSVRVPMLCIAGLALVIPTACSSASETPASEEGTSANGTVADVLKKVEGMSSDERREALLKMAEDEPGELLMYSSMIVEVMSEVSDAFTEETGVEFLTYRAQDVVPRIMEEAKAEKLKPDLVFTGDRFFYPVVDAGLLAAYDSPDLENLVDGAAQPYYTIVGFQIYTVSHNTDLVSKDEAPQTYMDLADPRWKGVMALDHGDVDWYWSVSTYLQEEEGYTDEQLDEYWQAVADNVDFTSSHSGTRAQTSAGEYDVFATDYTNGVNRDAEELGAPISNDPLVSPIFATSEAGAIMNRTDKPAKAILFMDYLISSGQEVFKELYFDVPREDLLDVDPGVDFRIIDADAFREVEAEMTEEFNALQS